MSGSGPASGPCLPLRSLLPAGPLHAREKPRGGGGRSLPAFLSAVAAFIQAADVSDHVLRDQVEVTSGRRPHDAYPARPSQPRARRRCPPATCSRWAWPGTLWHGVRHAAPPLRKSGHFRIAPTCEGASIRHPTGASIASRDRSMRQLGGCYAEGCRFRAAVSPRFR